jgi:hypothetical protein
MMHQRIIPIRIQQLNEMPTASPKAPFTPRNRIERSRRL